MASAQCDSELMTNYVAAVPVPGGSHFTTCLDPETKAPVVFALSNDELPKLQMIKQDGNGLRQLVDLNSILQIPAATPVQCFEARQGTDLQVYLVVATKFDDSKSNLLVVKPFNITLTPRLSLLPVQTIGKVHRLFMTDPCSTTSYPTIYGAHNPITSLSASTDITRIIVDLPSSSWALSREQELPTNADKIYSIAPGTTKFGEGLFVLCRIKGEVNPSIQATFYRVEDGEPIWFMVPLKCPPGATSLAVVTENTGRSSLLVTSPQGLWYFDTRNATNQVANPLLVSADPLVKDATDLIVTQDSDVVSIWISNQKGQLSYITTSASSIEGGSLIPVELLEEGRASAFSMCITKPDPSKGRTSAWQAIVTNNNEGNLTLLQQHRDTGIWRQEPFVISYTKKNVKVESYTISIHVTTPNKENLTDGQVLIKSSSAITAVANGRTIFLSPSGSWTGADQSGEISLIVPTTSISGQALTLSQVRTRDGTDVQFSEMVFDPSRKVLQAMGSLTSLQGLKDAKTRDQKPLWKSSEMPSDDDLKTAVKCFQAMHEATQSLPANGQIVKKAAAEALSSVRNLHKTAEVMTGNILMDGFYWVKQRVSDAVDWLVQKVGEVWEFTCKIGDKIKTFVLDCLEKIGEAATWVFDKIKLGWEKLKEFAGFLFGWSDILETKNSIKAVLNAGLDLGAEKIDSFIPKIDGFFTDLQGQIVKALSPPSKSISGKSADDSSSSRSKEVQSSASYKWAGERLKNGGSGSGAVVHSDNPDDKQAADSWANDFKPLLGSIEAAAKQTGNDIAKLFEQAGTVSTDELLSTGSKFLVRVLEVVKQFTIALTKSLRRLVKLLKDLGNKKIDLWIFSDLYEELTGSDLTLFDAVSLVVAIPTCIMIKAVTKAKPPIFTGMNSKLLGQLVSKDASVSVQQQIDWNTFTSGMALGVVAIKGVFGLIKLAYKALTGGADAALGQFSPGKTVKVISIGLDVLGIINALPGNQELPAPKLRNWISVLSLIRLSTNTLSLIIPENPVMEKVEICIELVTTLAIFGLYSAVYYFELSEPWSDKDEATTTLCVIGNGLNAVAGIGSFAANMGKLEAPHMTAVGVVVMTVGTYGLMAMEGFMFERQYEKKKQMRMLTPSV